MLSVLFFVYTARLLYSSKTPSGISYRIVLVVYMYKIGQMTENKWLRTLYINGYYFHIL